VLRDLNRPLFGKTGTTSGPTNVWFVGGTPDIVAGVYMGYDHPRPMGGYAQGGRIAAPIFKQWAKVALNSQPKVPFVAPAGIRWVRIDRATGKKVFGVFPTTEDPKSPVIWEAFQPQTEPRRSYRRSEGNPYDPQQQQQQIAQLQAQLAQRRQQAGVTVHRPRPVSTQQAGLPTVNTVQ
jgi:penicillin-binding protein 1A